MLEKNRRMAARKKSVTLRDVAQVAGTTPMTVSNVLNNRAGAVSEALARRVIEISEQLGYRAHAPARRLRTQRNQAIGVVLVDASPDFLSDPLTAAMLSGLTSALGRRDYRTILHGIAPEDVDKASFMRLIETDGICLILSGPEMVRRRVMDKVSAIEQPLIVIQEELPDAVTDGACVYLDDRRGAKALARTIIPQAICQQKICQVAMLVPMTEWPAMARREAGIREALAEMDAAARFKIVRSPSESFEACQAALMAHIRQHEMPDVLLGGNDRMAIAGMKLLQGMGVRVPEDVQVAGFNGLEFHRYVTPELTTVLSPAFTVGATAADAMLKRLETGSFPFRELVVPVELVIRGSTRARPDTR